MILSERAQIQLLFQLENEWIGYDVAELKETIAEIQRNLRQKYPGQTTKELMRLVRAEYDVEYAKEKERGRKTRGNDSKAGRSNTNSKIRNRSSRSYSARGSRSTKSSNGKNKIR
jgi:hypothetical protein